MNIELKKEKISALKCAYDLSCEQSIDLEVNLPDYCSDIKRVLRCFVVPGIASTQITGDRVSARGDITVRLVYVGEDEKMDCCEHTVELSGYADAGNMPENPIVIAGAVTEYVNCRAASQRRFTVNGNVGINFKIYCTEEKSVCCASDDDTLETRCAELEAVTQCALGEKTFDISETVSLPQDKKPMGRILHCDAFAKIDSVKTVNGKVLLKGDLVCNVLYCADTKDSSLETLSHTMPISQIIEVGGLDDKYEIEVCTDVKNLIVSAKADSSGSNRLAEIAAKVCAFIKGVKTGRVKYITDCYCTKYESKPQFESISFMRPCAKIDKSVTAQKAFDLSAQNAKEILDVRCISSACSVSPGTSGLDGKASVLFAVIFKDSKGKVQYAERNADFDFDCELKEKCEKIICSPQIVCESSSYTFSQGKLSVKAVCRLSGEVYNGMAKDVLCAVLADENKPKTVSDAAITVYYCSAGERIWDIAKRYNKKEKSIIEENNLDEETVKEDMMLII